MSPKKTTVSVETAPSGKTAVPGKTMASGKTTISGKVLFKYGIQTMQLLLLCIAIIVPMRLGMERLTFNAIVNIAFDWMTMFMLIVVFHNCSNGRVLDNTKEIMGFIISVYICVFCEVGIWSFDALEQYRVLNYVCNIGSNCTILAGAYIYFLFIRKSGDINNEVFPWLRDLLRTVMIIGITAEVLNCRGGYFYVIDEAGVYKRSPYGSYLGYIPFLIIIIGSAVFILRQKLGRRKKMAYMSYCILPFLCSLWYTFTGYPPTFFVAAAMSVLLIHGDIYVVQSKESEFYELENAKKEAEYALSRNMLMLSQIKPHFMYNSLGSIEVLCKLDPEKAARAIHHFTHYLRSNMDIVNSGETIAFAKELEHIRNYVWLEQMRFGEDLEYREELETIDFVVPQLCVQPIVENAIKHGMMGKEEGILHIVLKTAETEEEFIISVCDDGCGFDPDKMPDDNRSHLGISSTAYSLQLCVNGTMEIDSKIGVGTNITLRIPKNQGGQTDDDTCGR